MLSKVKTASLALLVVAGVSGGALAWARRTAEPSPQTVEIKITPTKQPPAGGPAPTPATFPGRTAAALQNAPTLADFRDPIPVFGTGSILLVESSDGKSLEARSVDSEDVAWQKLAIPAGIRVTPVAGEDTLALIYEGESIKELAAFSAYTGEWKTVATRRSLPTRRSRRPLGLAAHSIRPETRSMLSAHKRVHGTS